MNQPPRRIADIEVEQRARPAPETWKQKPRRLMKAPVGPAAPMPRCECGQGWGSYILSAPIAPVERRFCAECVPGDFMTRRPDAPRREPPRPVVEPQPAAPARPVPRRRAPDPAQGVLL